MKILVIGKNGQTGAALLKKAKEFRYDVKGFSQKELDITDKKILEKKISTFKPDVIINTAAYHVVKDCEEYPEKAFLVNTVAVKYLVDICKKRKIIFIHYSTDKVFNGDKKTGYIENDKRNALQIYGISKIASEDIALSYNDRTYIVRTCGIFGNIYGSPSKGGNFVLYILKEAKQNTELEVSSEQIVSVVNADDLAEATLKLLKKKAQYGVYHLTNSGYCSWAEFAAEIVKQSGVRLKIIPVDRKGLAGGMRIPRFTGLANKKGKKIGIILPPWKDGLARYLSFLKENS